MFPKNPLEAAAVIAEWSEYFRGGPANDLGRPAGPPEPAFGHHLLGFAAGDDPFWKKLQKISPGHFTPLEAFSYGYPDEKVEASDLSVLCWVLPQTEATLGDQRKSVDWPCERWVRSRFHGQKEVIEKLAEFILERLRDSGVQAVIPDHLSQWRQGDSIPVSSPWSHRHVAFAAGLGTFWLCDGLITPLGKAVRLLSVVARHHFPVTERKYSEAYEYCLYHSSGTCAVCVKRCPRGAISKEKGHDKVKCRAFLDNEIMTYVSENWADLKGAYGCGLCQSAVPCERSIPGRQPKARPVLQR